MIHVSKKLFSRDDLAVISVISLILMVAVEAWWLCSGGGCGAAYMCGEAAALGGHRGCFIAPFTFLHQAIVLRHGPFWHNHNVIIITVAAAAFAATALCVEMGFTQTFLGKQNATVKVK